MTATASCLVAIRINLKRRCRLNSRRSAHPAWHPHAHESCPRQRLDARVTREEKEMIDGIRCKNGALKAARCGRLLLFEQFKENLGLAREFTGTVRDGLMSAQAAWRKAAPAKRAIWLLVPTAIVVSAVAEQLSAPWYYEVAVLTLVAVLVAIGSGMRRKLP